MTTALNTPSILRCEPRIIDNSDCDENQYGMRYPFPVTVWRIFVDEECIAQKALPFAVGDAVIQLSANPCLPFLGEGGDYVLARQVSNKIIWFRVAEYNWTTLLQEFSHVDSVYCFEMSQYIAAIQDGGDTQVEAALPPHLNTEEIRTFLKKVFPRYLDLPLYRIPEREGDTRGEKLFRQVWNVLSSGELCISDAPEKPVEIHIGLDTHEFSEAIWQVGKIGDEVAVLFLAEPYFPIWVSGFAQAFGAEDALFESAEDIARDD
ncbi:MAG: hypothetical protein ABI690_00815 [Chloroflexota bacterium]